MESRENTVRVKEEPNDTWTDADDDYIHDSVDSCEVKHFDKLPFYELSVNPITEVTSLKEKLSDKIFVDFKCKNAQSEPTSLSTNTCKSKGQNFPSVVKIEKENHIIHENESIFIDIECKDVKLEPKSATTIISKTEYQSYSSIVKIENQVQTSNLKDKDLIILIKKQFDYDNNCRFQVNPPLKFGELKDVKKLRETFETKLSYDYKISRKTYKGEMSIKRQVNEAHKINRPYNCDISQKSFEYKSNLNKDINTVHNHIKSFECHICLKSLRYKNTVTLKFT
ncbi:uncharacterized protein LOC106655948 [Trichogramma pretiosum]|uniref:uncharacterized protein LOC106655948 n=1 Tax=Trichogramma pretiosum TaxID=7493 RepID=UPI0006C95530|nr:uncharacterized protein LOC106655948 [Trichogramma pretiosum]